MIQAIGDRDGVTWVFIILILVAGLIYRRSH